MGRVKFSIPWILFAALLFLASCHPGSGKEGASAAMGKPVSLEEINEKIRDHPANPENYIERARYYIAAQSAENAIVDIRKAISLDEKNADYFVLLSEVYLLSGRPTEC